MLWAQLILVVGLSNRSAHSAKANKNIQLLIVVLRLSGRSAHNAEANKNIYLEFSIVKLSTTNSPGKCQRYFLFTESEAGMRDRNSPTSSTRTATTTENDLFMRKREKVPIPQKLMIPFISFSLSTNLDLPVRQHNLFCNCVHSNFKHKTVHSDSNPWCY